MPTICKTSIYCLAVNLLLRRWLVGFDGTIIRGQANRDVDKSVFANWCMASQLNSCILGMLTNCKQPLNCNILYSNSMYLF